MKYMISWFERLMTMIHNIAKIHRYGWSTG